MSIMDNPWRQPCPTCGRPACDWHTARGRCDGRPLPFHLDAPDQIPPTAPARLGCLGRILGAIGAIGGRGGV